VPKNRTKIPDPRAAEVEFASDRTCCVCRTPGRPYQLHQLDEDPTNHDFDNLAVLCLDCHDESRGGFSRKLRLETILRYRDDWYRIVAKIRDGHRDSRVAAGMFRPGLPADVLHNTVLLR